MPGDSLAHTKFKSLMRRRRSRMVVRGSGERPRLSVNISNYHVSAQIINDQSGKTLAYATTVGRPVTGTMTDKAAWVGAEIAKRAAKAKVKKVFFDRGGGKYHGRLKSLAEAARANGLEF